MSNYNFPFDTCEKPYEDGITQPYSVAINSIVCIMIFYFLCKSQSFQSFLLLFSILCFELFHVFSHTIHIKGHIQTNIIHILAYLVNITLFYLLTKYSYPSSVFLFFCFTIILFDIYAVFFMNVIYQIISQIVLLSFILTYYTSTIKKYVNQNAIMLFLVLGILLIVNEKYNCHTMQIFYPDFPYHIFIEIIIFVIFYLICSGFYRL